MVAAVALGEPEGGAAVGPRLDQRLALDLADDVDVVLDAPEGDDSDDDEGDDSDDEPEQRDQDARALSTLSKHAGPDRELARKRLAWERLVERQRSDAAEQQEQAPRAHFRRATTVAVPLSAAKRQLQRLETQDSDADSARAESPASDEHADKDAAPAALARAQSWSCPRRAAAVEAIEERRVRFRFSTAASARDVVREMHSLRLREFPIECCVAARVQLRNAAGVWRAVDAQIDRDGFCARRTSTFRKKVKGVRLSHDDILAASLADGSKAHELTVHFMSPGRGERERRLKREYETLHVRFEDLEEARRWLQAFQTLAKWSARVPMAATRKIKVVVNPHSGKRRGREVWRKWQALIELAGIECDVEETTYSGHARDIGASFDLSKKYEAMVFVGGDGTVNEFMNGVFSRPESEWRHLVATTPVSLICAGTDNAFGVGVGTPTHEASVYCIIKRKIRPLDVMAVEGQNEDGSTRREFSCTGISWGVGSDIALESEATRWLGVYRYMYLKVKRVVIAPRKHVCRVQYVLSDSVPVDDKTGEQVLRTYFDIMDKDADDQHHIEMCSVYDESYTTKLWMGDASAIYHPASEAKFGDRWQQQEGQFTTMGASNVYFEAKYSHPSDGNLDLIYSRKGTFAQTLDLGVRYIGGDYLKSEIVGYHKVRAMVIDPVSETPLNVDGEVFPLPGPFRIEVVPQLLCVLSEK